MAELQAPLALGTTRPEEIEGQGDNSHGYKDTPTRRGAHFRALGECSLGACCQGGESVSRGWSVKGAVNQTWQMEGPKEINPALCF